MEAWLYGSLAAALWGFIAWQVGVTLAELWRMGDEQ